MPVRRIFQEMSISMRTPMVAVWKKLRTGIGRGRAGAADDLQRRGVFHVHVACSETSNSGASPSAVAKSELRKAISRPAVAWVDSTMLMRFWISLNQFGWPDGPGIKASERPWVGFMITVMLSEHWR